MEAAKRNNTIAAEVLIVKLNANLDSRNNMRHTAISIASMNGHLGVVCLLVD
jgi:ankyrin repeat protein